MKAPKVVRSFITLLVGLAVVGGGLAVLAAQPMPEPDPDARASTPAVRAESVPDQEAGALASTVAEPRQQDAHPEQRRGAHQVAATDEGEQPSMAESAVIDKKTLLRWFPGEDPAPSKPDGRSAKLECWADLASPARAGASRKVGIQQPRPSLVPAEEIEVDTAALRDDFAEEVRPLGLEVGADVEVAVVHGKIKRASIIAVRAGDAEISGVLFQQRDSFFVATLDAGTARLATRDFIIEREGNQVTCYVAVRLHEAMDRLAGGPTGFGGLVIEHSTTFTFDDFDALILAAQRLGDPLEFAELLGMPSAQVADPVSLVTVTGGLGQSISYAPGEMALHEALAALRGGGASCPGCYSDCFAAFDCTPTTGQYLCAIAGVLFCIPACVTPLACGICVGAAVLLCGIPCDVAGLVGCWVDCIFNAPPSEIADCCGNCAPQGWVSDTYCDDGSYDWPEGSGIWIYFNCPEYDCDGGDCSSGNCAGCGGADGVCCYQGACLEVSQADCEAGGGNVAAGADQLH